MIRMAGICLLAPLLAALSSLPARGAEPPSRDCRIVGVQNAATFSVRCGDLVGTLRVPGVRAPRAGPPQLGGEPFAEESRRLAEELLRDRAVHLDRSGGTPTVVLDGEDLALAMLRRGWVYLESAHTGAAAARSAAERHARGERLGVWSEEAWNDLQDRLTEPVTLEPPAPPPAAPALGERSRVLSGKPWEERKKAFEEAVRELEGDPD